MLLKDKIQTVKLSANERIIADFILEKGSKINEYSTRRIASETYTNPATVVSLAHKLGFSGWTELRDIFVQECLYLKDSRVSIDANIPFNSDDSQMDIAGIITKLYVETADDTLFLLDEGRLQRAVDLLNNADRVFLFAAYDVLYCAQEMAYKLESIGKDVVLHVEQEMMYHDAARADRTDCAIILSYSGGTIPLLRTASILKENHVPVLAVTSIGVNELSKMADCVLNVCTREKDVSKIGNYTSIASFHLILDILYSCLFALDYDRNMKYKIGLTRHAGTHKIIDNGIIKENED